VKCSYLTKSTKTNPMTNDPQSYGRQIREQTASQEFNHKKVSEHLTRVLGFVANQHKDAIIHDINKLIGQGLSKELNGFVLALSHCMEHDLAWHCLSEAYRFYLKPIPDKYYRIFNKERSEDQSPPPTMRVE